MMPPLNVMISNAQITAVSIKELFFISLLQNQGERPVVELVYFHIRSEYA